MSMKSLVKFTTIDRNSWDRLASDEKLLSEF